MKNLILLVLIFSGGTAVAEVVDSEGLCRSFRLKDQMYSLSFTYDFHGGEFLTMKRYSNAGVARSLHGGSSHIMADSSEELGMENVKVVASEGKRCDEEVKIVQLNDNDGNNMDLRVSFTHEIEVAGSTYYSGRFENLYMDGKQLPPLYRQLACSKTNIDALKSTLIQKCMSSKSKGTPSGVKGHASSKRAVW